MNLILLLGLLTSSAGVAADGPVDSASVIDKTLVSVRHSNEKLLMPGDFDGDIARTTGLILQQQHYSQKGFNSEISSKFLDRYLDTLDGLHLYFLKSDVESFEMFRKTLDKLTLRRADPTPAYAIFNRFMDRVEQQYAYVHELLHDDKGGHWDFSTDERYTPNRKDLERPKDLTEAKQFWRSRIRYEYLQEKLNLQRAEDIGRIVREKAEQKKPAELMEALKDKLGKEKLTNLLHQVEAGLAKSAKPEAIADSVVAQVRKDQHEEIVKVISRRYSRIVRMFRDFDNDDVMQYYLSALAHIYDPHTDYLNRGELDNFSISMNLSLFGIGAVLRSEDGYCKIQELMAAGPAARSGKLKPNDKIVAVAQGDGEFTDVVEMKLRKVVDLIRGPKGSRVRLRVNPADAPDPSIRKEIELVRDEIKLEDQEAKARIHEFPDADGKIRKVGLIDLPSFYATFAVGSQRRDESDVKSTTKDVARLLERLVKENVSGVILDLRRNGGGSLEEAINLTGLFIKKGPIVQVRNADDTVEVDEDTDPKVQYDGPLMVLTSRFSASASEILAGALQDYGRALIVGDSSTHGKGTVQSVIQLGRMLRTTNNLGAVKLTIRKFYRASGDSTQKKGVVPDLVLPSVNNVLDVGEAELDNALEFDTIKPASYDKVNRVAGVLGEIKARSDKRVAGDKDFAYIRQEMDRYLKIKADKTVSLNEEQRRTEKDENKARVDGRKKELQARGEPPGKIYEFKLKDVNSPQLPPPLQKTNKLASVKGAAKGQGSDEKSAEPVSKSDELDDDEPVVDDSVPDIDITLEEAKRIILDFVALRAAEPDVAGAR
jgi:carboxyl-terminal processing protease